MSSSVQRGEAPLFLPAKTCRAALDWTDEDICPYVVHLSLRGSWRLIQAQNLDRNVIWTAAFFCRLDKRL
jgi:hypothetical protein